MSGHFVYEIDERKLRVKLQEIEVEQTPDAWSDFETFYLSKNNQKHDHSIKDLNIPISMNVLLPLGFGIIIIVIAVLLFKFISIKNPPLPDTVEQSTPLKTQEMVKPDNTVKPNITNKMREDSLQQAAITTKRMTDSLMKVKQDSITNSITKSQTISADKNPPTSKPAKEDKIVVSSQSNTIANNSAETKEPVKQKKKKTKKSTSDSAEQDKVLEETILNLPDENEASLKPN